MQYSVIKVKCLKIRANVVPSVYGIVSLKTSHLDVPGMYNNIFIRSVMRSKRLDFESLAILKFTTALILFSLTKKRRQRDFLRLNCFDY